jgi:hypothetical protein
LSYDGSFAREWINTLLNIPELISAPDHLHLFSLPVLIDASGAQKRQCALISLTQEYYNPFSVNLITFAFQTIAAFTSISDLQQNKVLESYLRPLSRSNI